MGRKNKRFREIEKLVDLEKDYTLTEAIDILKQCPSLKFDQSLEVSLKLGIDPRKSDQVVRSSVSLPNGTGKTTRVLVFAKGDKVQEALDAGADYAGNEEYITKVVSGWTDFDVAVATPDMMREVGKLGKVLGPRGLMPAPKAGTVTTNVAQAVQEVKAGKIEFRSDRHGVVNNAVGKISFETKALEENIQTFLKALSRMKPASAKGNFLHSLYLSSTMGPGLKIQSKEIALS
jgi:large subunit ribosomal protein L1